MVALELAPSTHTDEFIMALISRAVLGTYTDRIPLESVIPDVLPNAIRGNVMLLDQYKPLDEQDKLDVQELMSVIARSIAYSQNPDYPISESAMMSSVSRAQRAVDSILQLILSNPREEQESFYIPTLQKVLQLSKKPTLFEVASPLYKIDEIISQFAINSRDQTNNFHEKTRMRQDVRELLFPPTYLTIPTDTRMLVYLRKMSPGAIILHLANLITQIKPDGKTYYSIKELIDRFEASCDKQFTHVSDFKSIDLIVLKKKNYARQFKALNNWLQRISTLTLEELIVLVRAQESHYSFQQKTITSKISILK